MLESFNITSNQRHYLVNFAWVFVAGLAVYFFRPSYLLSELVVLLPPLAYTLYCLPRAEVKRILRFALFSAVMFAPPVEFVARLNNIWDVQSTFPRILGLVPPENLIFAFVNFAWFVGFYKLVRPSQILQAKNLGRQVVLTSLYFLLWPVIYLLYKYQPNWLVLSYFQLSITILFVPLVYFLFTRPSSILETWRVTLFFALLLFWYEVISLLIGSWWWPLNNYFYTIAIAGRNFPIDDVIIWYLISTPVLLVSYDYFVDGA